MPSTDTFAQLWGRNSHW